MAPGDLFNIYSPWGIAWVMALFEGTVAFVMISAAMKSMDPSLEESARVLGAGKLRTALRVTLPLVAARRPERHDLRVRGDAGLIRCGLRARHSGPLLCHHDGDLAVHAAVLRPTTAAPRRWVCRCSWSCWSRSPLARLVLRKGSYATITGKAFRPRPMDVGALAGRCSRCLGLHLRRGVPADCCPVSDVVRSSPLCSASDAIHPRQLRDRAGAGPVGRALINSLMLGSQRRNGGRSGDRRAGLDYLPLAHAGRARSEYLVMFPQAVPRLVFGLGLLWAWLNMPIPIYGTLWLLALAYFTVSAAGSAHARRRRVADRQESGGMRARLRRRLGLPDAHHHPATAEARYPCGLAADLHRFVRELGASVFLMGPNAKVIAPAIVNALLSRV